MAHSPSPAHFTSSSTHSQASFAQAKTWVQTLRRQADPSITIILVGNKLDLAPSSRGTERELAEAYAEEEGLLFVEASAKTGENVQEVFMQVVSPDSARFLIGLRGVSI
jgi:GTPase SAR1 family protein